MAYMFVTTLGGNIGNESSAKWTLLFLNICFQDQCLVFININDVFLDEFKTRVFDNDKQVWSASMSNMPKLRTLVLFKSNISVENYLLLHIPRRLRVALAKFIVGNHDLEIEKGRYVKVPVMKDFVSYVLLWMKIILKTNIMYFSSVHFMTISEKYIYVSIMILLIYIPSLILCTLKIRRKLFN